MTMTLPLFPLNAVLFPGQLLPLHIFEARYRQMIGECLRAGAPFGVVLIRSGEEVGEMAEPHPVGTTARIIQADKLDDGRMNIICVGNARFRIQQTYHDQPYLRGTIDLWPWLPFAENPDHPHLDRIRRWLDRYIHALAEITQTDVNVELPADPATLANMAAAVLQIGLDEKQQLLTTASIGELLDRIGELLQRELRGLQIVHAARLKPPEESAPFSQN
jgi:Lon protease-like protein